MNVESLQQPLLPIKIPFLPNLFILKHFLKLKKMASALNYLTEGTRIFLSSWKNRLAPKKYSGTAEEICQQIVKDCWNGRYFTTSTGNFKQFWTRDFFWCIKSLLSLGYDKEVQKTLHYAMKCFKRANKITTTITPRGRAYDFPYYAIDSLPCFLHCLKISGFPYEDHHSFLNKEIRKYYHNVIDRQTGLIVANKTFSSMKDFAARRSSCYDNCMTGMLAADLKDMKLCNPFKNFNYSKIIKENYWNGKFFYDDATKSDYVAGDANVFPFLLGLVPEPELFETAMNAMAEARLDKPFPLKYTATADGVKFIWQSMFLKNYESNAVWMHLGPFYIKLLQKLDAEKAAELKENYKQLIEKYGNYLEVFTADGQPYQTFFYHCDSGMLWAANYLTL